MGAVDQIESDIRTALHTKRIRVTEFFKDYDRLRCGYITPSQFKRCVDQCLSVRLTEEQANDLIEKYCTRKNGKVNYRAFSDAINQNFQANTMNVDPVAQTHPPLEYLGTERTYIPDGPEELERVNSILQKIQNYYTYHGVNIRTCYEDFDKHNNGLVTFTQFARRFPGPPDVTEEDVELLAHHYKDPTKAGLTNYLNFHHDVETLKHSASLDNMALGSKTYLFPSITDDPDLRIIFDKIRVAVYKNGIRTPEFFKDHDKLRSGIITENQFLAGLTIGLAKEAHLTSKEISSLAEFYKGPDGRVLYKPFCDMMEHAFNIPSLEKKPTCNPIAPPSGSLSRALSQLSDEDEQQLIEILSRLSEIVRKRRLMLYPYFKDFDRGVAYTRNITKTQFGRILHFLTLDVTEKELKLLCRKFVETVSGDVNYPAFCQAIDKEFSHYTVDAPLPIPSTRYVPEVPPPGIDTSMVDFNQMISRIRHHVLVNRIRVREYFEDYDQLRSGSVTRSIFARAINLMRVTWLDQAHTHALQNWYTNPKDPNCVLWTDFLKDIESVFTQPNLEKDPTRVVPPQETFVLPKEGTFVEWNKVSTTGKAALDEAMARMRSKAVQRRLLATPVFQDFDKHNNGHVSRFQFRQCLAVLELHTDEIEIDAIEAKFTDNMGFDYVRFLDELIPEPRVIPKYKEHIRELQATNAHKKPHEIDPLTDVNAILTKIKSKVSKQRMRLNEFMKDYDKLKTGRMLIINFERALDLAGLELKESEVKILDAVFQSHGQPDFVDYRAFCDEVESIFTTKHLEKTPLVTPVQFKPPVEWQQNALCEEGEVVYNKAIDRLGEHVHKTRVQLFPLFEDYDRVHIGSVSRSQFRRVISELEMGSLLSDQEFKVIYNKFNVRVGGKNDINYIAFCDRVYEAAKFDPFKP